MKDNNKPGMIAKRRLLSACALLLIGVFVAVSPKWIGSPLERNEYLEWMELKTEPKVTVINVWHIVGFKPYVGSLGSWLETRAREYRGDLIGIHFEIASLSPEEAENRLARGMKPDIVSFMSGTRSGDEFIALSGYGAALRDDDDVLTEAVCAVPYCASGRLLLFDPIACEGMDAAAVAAEADTPERFKAGKAPACICDIRAAGDIYRAGLMGSAPYFEAEPYDNGEPYDLVQYLGIRRGTDEAKLKYATGFIRYLLTTEVQSKLGSLGLIPIDRSAEPEYDAPWLRELFEAFDPDRICPCFGRDQAPR